MTNGIHPYEFIFSSTHDNDDNNSKNSNCYVLMSNIRHTLDSEIYVF